MDYPAPQCHSTLVDLGLVMSEIVCRHTIAPDLQQELSLRQCWGLEQELHR